jgi:hypothetical protein
MVAKLKPMEIPMNIEDVATAPTSELVKEYNEQTGKSIKKFSDRATAERKVKEVLPASPKEKKKPTGRIARDRSAIFIERHNEGTTKISPNSLRGKLLVNLPEGEKISWKDLEEKVGFSIAGPLQKLEKVGHVRVTK